MNYAIELRDSTNIQVHHNAFLKEHQTGIYQARELSSTGNIWYDDFALEGNFWQGWNTSLPYPIDGGISEDLYPLDTNPIS